MAATRPNPKPLHLELDEQSFQSLLSAAFTIQEHNDQQKRAGLPPVRLEGTSVCPHCGALKRADETRCEKCSLEKFRPGERLQRNWASMWLMSQEQGLWPERPSEPKEASTRANGGAQEAVSPLSVKRQITAHESASNGLLAWPATQIAKNATVPSAVPAESDISRDEALDHEAFDEAILHEKDIDESTLAASGDASDDEEIALDSSDAVTAAGASTDGTREDMAEEYLAPEELDRNIDHPAAEQDFPALKLFEGDDSSAAEGSGVANPAPGMGNILGMLRAHRANVYLAAAVSVAFLALLWPAAGGPQRAATLSPWDRFLVTVGLAEAPAPVVHLRGDPNIQVWIDPHTALYYCPGEELYGKTAGGRNSSQVDAQMDRFEPAGRSVCE